MPAIDSAAHCTACFPTDFCCFALTGIDSKKFLQGQLTLNIDKLTQGGGAENTTVTPFFPAAICNLKGRVQFGLWIKAITDGFCIVLSADLADDFAQHVKKYAAFSKVTLSTPMPIYPCLVDGLPSFCDDKACDQDSNNSFDKWARLSLVTGNYWITRTTSGQFQPQELRLHQRGGVDYDKGCYLGQEVVARLYFRASPKAFLHLVQAAANEVLSPGQVWQKLAVVNCLAGSTGVLALVVGRPDDVAATNAQVLPLPGALSEAVGRL